MNAVTARRPPVRRASALTPGAEHATGSMMAPEARDTPDAGDIPAPDLDTVARECACRRARMAARKVTRSYDEALRPTGLKATQFTLLVAVAQGSASSITRLADFLAMERTTLTRNIQLLERRGLIAVGPEGARRARKLALTAEGRRALNGALPYWRKAQESLRANLGEDDWQAAGRGIEALLDGA